MATTDSVQQLAGVINRLYDLAGSDGVSPEQQQALALQAHDLRGDLIALVAMKLDASNALYSDLMTGLKQVTDALNQTEAKIQQAVTNVNSAAAVAAAVDGLIQKAITLAAAAAKLSVA